MAFKVQNLLYSPKLTQMRVYFQQTTTDKTAPPEQLVHWQKTHHFLMDRKQILIRRHIAITKKIKTNKQHQ